MRIKRDLDFGEYMHHIYFDENRDLKHSIKSITFIVTEDCSMRCSYCYQHVKRPNRMTFEVAKNFIDKLLNNTDGFENYIDSPNCLGCTLEFIGGEPFLEVKLIDQIVDYFRTQTILLHHPWANRFRVSIASNGLAYFEPDVQKFITKNADVLALSVTVDGNKQLHDACRHDKYGNPTYDRAIVAAKHYASTPGGQLNSKFTIAPGNVQYVSDAVFEMIRNGYDSIFLNCVYEEGWTYQHATTLYYELKKISDFLLENNLDEEIFLTILDPSYGHAIQPDNLVKWCGGTGLMIAVDWKGDIFPCTRYADNSICGKQEPWVLGNVYDGIGATKEQQDRIDCMNCIDRRTQTTDECFYCPIASGCGECSAYNYEVFGTPDKKATFICVMHQARVMATSYLWNKKHIKNPALFKQNFTLDIPKEWALKIISEDEYKMLKELEEGGSNGISNTKPNK